MRNNYFFISFFAFLLTSISYGQAEKFYLDFEGVNPLTNLPTGVTNINGTNTVRVKNTTDYPATPNVVQTDPNVTGENELFLDFQGYLKMDITDTSAGFSLAYDYRRNNLNDDWYLGFLTFIGNDGAANRLEQLLIREWDGQFEFGGQNTGGVKPIGFDTNYHVVVTVSSIGDLKVYVNNTEVFSVPNSTSSHNIHTWSNAGLLLSFKGASFDGTNVTPEPEFASSARDARSFVDNVALFERELSSSEISTIYNNGNDAFSNPATEVAFLDFEGVTPLSTLPSGVTNINGTNTVRVKNTTDYPATPNVVQVDADAAGEKELFLDFQGYLKLNVADASTGFSVAYDYRRNNDNDDWNLGFLTFIGNDGTSNRLEQLLIREWDGQFEFGGQNTGGVKPIGFDTNYHVVVTIGSTGNLVVYVNGSEVFNVPNSTSGHHIHNWTNASLLLSFKGSSFDGTNVTPEPDFASNARDARAYVDNIALFNGALSATEVAILNNNGNNSLSVNKFTATDSNWNNASNWSFSAIPLTTDNVEIPATRTANVDITNAKSQNLTVDGTLNINTGQGLDVNGDLNINGSFSINSGGTLMVSGTSTGNITYKRTLTANADPTKSWHLLSAPVSGESVVDFIANNTLATGTTNTNFRGIANYKIDGAGWNYYLSTYNDADAFDAGKGYSVKNSVVGDVNFIGTYTNGNKEYNINQTTSNFNLVGNPYAAYINLGTFFTDNNTANRLTEQTIWLWNPDKSGTGLGGYVQKMSGTDAGFEIAPGQGFFVNSGTASSNKVTFNATNQSHQSDTFLKSARTEIHLNVKQDNVQHQTKLYYINGTSTDFDNGFDGSMFSGINYDLAVYSKLVANNNDSKNLGIQSLPNSDLETMIVPVGLKASANKEIIFSTETLNLPAGIKVFLEDKVNNTFTRLDEVNSNYKITLTEAVNGTGRFYIHTTQSILNIDQNVSLNNINIYKSDNNLKVIGLQEGKANVSVYNILGKQVVNTSFQASNTNNVHLPKLSTGIYIVKIQTENGSFNKKIIIE
tara:strand:+ start:888 stop:3974 length:3087 start_codon:yes stop_codon:yes gene_type:complete